MAQVYVNLIYAGRRTWKQVPNNLKESVNNILKSNVAQGIITPERYKEITGESFVG